MSTSSTNTYPEPPEVEHLEERRTLFHSAERPLAASTGSAVVVHPQVHHDLSDDFTSQRGFGVDRVPSVSSSETRASPDSRPSFYSSRPEIVADRRSPVPSVQQADASYRTMQRMQYWPAASRNHNLNGRAWGSGSGLPAPSRHPSCQLPRPPVAAGGCDGCFAPSICACRRTSSGPAATSSNSSLTSGMCNPNNLDGTNWNEGCINPVATGGGGHSGWHHDARTSEGVTTGNQRLHGRIISAEKDHHDALESDAHVMNTEHPSHASESTCSIRKRPHQRQSSCSWQLVRDPTMEPLTAPYNLHTCPMCGYVNNLRNSSKPVAPAHSLSHSPRLAARGLSSEDSSVGDSSLAKPSHASRPPLSRLGLPPTSHYCDSQWQPRLEGLGVHGEQAVDMPRRENVFVWATRMRVQQSLMSGKNTS